jgi:acyl-CoA thioesterase-1
VAIQCPPLADHLPTEAEPFFAGRWTFGQGRGKPAALAIGGETFEVSMKTGGQTNVLVYGALAPADIRPFVYRAAVVGKEARGALVADEVHLEPVGDQAASDNPSLPRYLCIGDSISYNYAKALREALAGKANVHHPPTNCGPSGKGVGNIVEWLGAWEVKGRHWDVISFNFGHWDAGGTKEKYQANLEIVIREMKKTGAKLIWVTTCPVPEGCKPAGDLDANGKAPGRTAGVMKKYLNPWALEVMKRHPEIAVCDLWQFVADHRGDLYAEWWKGNNVHFSGEGADALGTVLARRVLEALGRKP